MLKRDQAWVVAHQEACKRSIWLLLRQPWSSLMTIVMIAITMMLAMLCWSATHQISVLGEYWQQSEHISLYLKQTLNEREQQHFLKQVQALSGVESAVLTTPAEGLALLSQQEGMQDIMQYMPQNPLPPVIQVIPSTRLQTPEEIKRFFQNFQHASEVDEVKFDTDWVERLYTVLGFLQQLVRFLMILFAVAVTLVIGNTLRLMIHNRYDEIRVLQLVGAPNQFIMRPFLYSGVWYGVLAAVLAIVFVDIFMVLLRTGVNQWAEYYHMHLTISLVPVSGMLGLIAAAMGLSWTGARLTLKYYL